MSSRRAFVSRNPALLALALAVALCGCQKFLRVAVTDPHSLAPALEFRSRPLGRPQTVKLRFLVVTIKRDGGTEEVVWRIHARAARVDRLPAAWPEPLRQVRYGVAPDGFDTEVAPRPLARGTTYRVEAQLRVEADEAVVGAAGQFTPAPGTTR